jgi:hypothetical protein
MQRLVKSPRRPQPSSSRPFRAGDPATQVRDLGPWLTEEAAMEHVAYAGSVRAFRMLVRRAGIPYGKLGAARRYRRGLLDAALENARWAGVGRRRRPPSTNRP